MKKILRYGLAAAMMATSTMAGAQERYLDEVFTDAEVSVQQDVTYGLNVDFMKNLQLLDPTYIQGNLPQIMNEVTNLKTLIQTGQSASIPTSHFMPYSMDTNTIVKISEMKMDMYYPDMGADTMSERPVMVYIHSGNFLPPVINGSYGGSNMDSAAVELCTQWAKRGYIAVAPNYRHGWNPVATGPTGQFVRTATLLNAVYRSIHDVKEAVRVVRASSATLNASTSNIGLYGQGSGGYVALAYNTLDRWEEVMLPKFTNPLTGGSVIDTNAVGNFEGYGGLLNLYYDQGLSSAIEVSVNAGGALADISWIDGNEAPQISLHAPRDPFAPFDTGTVIVPTTGDPVVDVNGPNTFLPLLNSLGVNDAFASLPDNDPYTIAARATYGTDVDNMPIINTNSTVTIASAEGMYPFIMGPNQGSPWDWWDETDLAAYVAFINNLTGGSYDANTIHQNGLATNPDMSKNKALTYIDTIQGYIQPRIMRSMQIGNWEALGTEELVVNNNNFSVFPNPTSNVFTIQSDDAIERVEMIDLTGRVVLSREVGVNNITLNVNDMPTGVYLVQVTQAGKSYVERLVIE